MTTPLTGPCEPWEPLWCTALPTGSAAVSGYALQAATEALYHATAQRFGLCTVTLRPCRRECATGWPDWAGSRWPQPLHLATGWINVTCGACTTGCSCSTVEETVLPAPVYDVTEVKVDGLVLATSAYRLDNHRFLVRVDGHMWPLCQDLNAADTQSGTWSVTARYGEPVPVLGRQAIGELAAELVRACLGEDCRLPSNVVSLARQGVTISYPEVQEFVERGVFGGLFIQTFNPKRLTARPAVYDVDAPTWRRTGT